MKSAPKRVLYVLAGSHAQFERYRDEHGSPDLTLRYVVKPDTFRGIRDAEFVRVGTWYERSDGREIEAALASARAKEVSK